MSSYRRSPHPVRSAFVLASVIGVVTAGACDRPSTPSPLTGPVTAGARAPSRSLFAGGADSAYGVSLNYPEDDVSLVGKAARFLANGGVGLVRVTAYWYLLQQGSDTNFTPWELTPLHETIDSLEAAGIQPMITLLGTACYARSETFPCADAYSAPDSSHWWAWQTYVAQMMHQFPTVKYWGIWNEPNSAFLDSLLYPSDTAVRFHDYERLLEYAAPVIHDSGRVVLAPDLADGAPTQTDAERWLSNLLADDGSLIDVVSVHTYRTNLADFSTVMSDYSAMLTSGQELWNSEAGYPSPPFSDENQAKQLAGMYELMAGGTIPGWTRLVYYDAGSPSLTVPDTLDYDLVHGLGTSSPATRPAWYCFVTLAGGMADCAPQNVTINGPSRIRPGATCTWYVNFDGSVAPFTYSWAENGEWGMGSDSSFTGSKDPGFTSSSFTLHAEVVSASNEGSTGSMTVTESATAPICLM